MTESEDNKSLAFASETPQNQDMKAPELKSQNKDKAEVQSSHDKKEIAGM